MQAYSQVKTLLDIFHFYLAGWVSKFIIFVFTYLTIHVSTNDLNVMFGNESNKERWFVIEGNDIHSITGISGTVARDNCYAGVVIKWSTHHFRLEFLSAIQHEDWEAFPRLLWRHFPWKWWDKCLWPISLYFSSISLDIGIMVRVFAHGPGDLGSIPGWVLPKTLKMVLDVSLLNTQHYKVRIKGKVEKSRERSSAPWCSSYRKGSLQVTLDYGRQQLVSMFLYTYVMVGWRCQLW